ncbi:MAG: acyloxyacyl hydrolase [Armatimonadetes bacterium]|nr:acyloxyacyl hydrolase [Armatimonadota bacterium]
MKRRAIAALLTLFLGPISLARAERLRFDSFKPGQIELGVGAAYGATHKIPSLAKDRARFDQFKIRVGRFSSPRLEFAVEIAAARQSNKPQNAGWSATGCLRYYASIRGSTAVALDLNIGLTEFEQRLTSQSTRINFTEQLGVAVQHSVGPSSAITIEYKFSHNSNAGIKMPNLGINASIVSIGWSWYTEK